MRDVLVGELAVLQRFLCDRRKEYRFASFLKNPFESPVWKIEINSVCFSIRWQLSMPDGSLLTDPQHQTLLSTFKSWLCIQDHPDTSIRPMLADVTKQRRLQRTLQLIDYFLVRADSLGLSTHGLQLLTENDIRALVLNFSRNSSTAISVYDWPNRIDAYLRGEMAALSDAQLESLLLAQPDLAAPFDDEPTTTLAGQDLLRARAWLWERGLYRVPGEHLPYDWGPDTVAIAYRLYSNTLWGTKTYKPVPRELLIFASDSSPIEKPRAPVRTQDDDRMSLEQLRPILGRLRSLTYLRSIDLPIPVEALKALDDKSLHVGLKVLGRFRTLPQQVVFSALRSSIEFFLKHGRALIDGYLNVVRLWVEEGKSQVLGVFACGLDFSRIISPHLRELGVQRWQIKRGPTGRAILTPSSIFFSELRANSGLIDMMRVLCGCMYICIGTLMARRNGELEELSVDCLDSTRTRLIFNNRKSGIAGKREKIARPIPPIAVEMIVEIQRMRNELMKMGVISEPGPLLAYPSGLRGRLVFGTEALFRALDLFCDYFELPLDESGRRYYIRQHQLRRFFAMLFFWGNSFGGMETLRWFLGQTDVEHLYNYITESMSGAALASVKAGYATDRLLQDAPEVQELSAMLRARYGAHAFSVMTREELDEHVTELVTSQDVTIEPEFFMGSHGREYRILVRVVAREPV